MKTQFTLFVLLSLSLLTYGQNSIEAQQSSYLPKGSLSLRTNAIPWILLVPNVGVEYKIDDHIGLIVDGGWARWNLNSQNKYWRIWNVAPQVRYYVGEHKYNYIGAQYTMGEYNLTGDQGKYIGGGLTFGHQFYASENLRLDLGLSLGYLYLYDKEKYHRKGNVNCCSEGKTSNGYWGPTTLSVTFVWKLFDYK